MKKSGSGGNIPDKGRIMPADPNLPWFICQNCRQGLCVVGKDSFTDKFFALGMQGSSITVTDTVVGSTRMDHSFVVLPKLRNQTPGVSSPTQVGAMHADARQSGKAIDKMEEEECKLEAAIAETEKQRAKVTAELKELELNLSHLK